MVGPQRSGSLEYQPCQLGSSAEHDGMSCIASSRSCDQTLGHHQQAERVLVAVLLRVLQRRRMTVSPTHVITGSICQLTLANAAEAPRTRKNALDEFKYCCTAKPTVY
jgi:hypothetical protein